MVDKSRNWHLDWCLVRDPGAREPRPTREVYVIPRDGSFTSTLIGSGTPQTFADEVVPYLVRATADPNRFAVAHVLLSERLGRGQTCFGDVQPDGSVAASFDGLDVTLTPLGPRKNWWWHDRSPRDGKPLISADARIDPAQLRAIRDHWHRTLGVPVCGVPYLGAAAAGLVLPAAWCFTTLGDAARERRRRRIGLCPACGYDLRATPEQCPECGARP